MFNKKTMSESKKKSVNIVFNALTFVAEKDKVRIMV